MRRIARTNKKLRGVARRLRALQRWTDSFTGWYPTGLSPSMRYWHEKVPVIQSLIEGNQAKLAVQRLCAQQLIDSCGNLIDAKPQDVKGQRVVATICLPDLFSSEVCIYIDEPYWRSQIQTDATDLGKTAHIARRSLVHEWGLKLPEGMGEIGIAYDYADFPEDAVSHVGERWFFGEV